MGSFKWTEEAEKLWNEKADSWNAKSEEMWEKGSRKDIVPFFQKHVQQGLFVCDFGCGDGYGTGKLARQGYQCVGIDVSKEMIQIANKKLPKIADFIQADISEVPFGENSFDAIIAINSLEWTESPLNVLIEMKRILKHQGQACIGILGPTAMPRINSFRRLYGEKVICNTMMPWEFERLAQENGWSKKDEMGVYKRGVNVKQFDSISTELKQAMSFMWVFMLENSK